jgi:lipoprotein-releasing system permease protein
MVSIFMTQGSVIGVVGTAIGAAAGLLLAFNATPVVAALQQATGITFVDPQVYFISELPSEVRAADVFLVAGVALALGVLATLYPAWRAARTQPADALRHEV